MREMNSLQLKSINNIYLVFLYNSCHPRPCLSGIKKKRSCHMRTFKLCSRPIPNFMNIFVAVLDLRGNNYPSIRHIC